VPVRELLVAAAGTVADDRSVLAHQRAPEERHELEAALLAGGGPELLVGGGVGHALALGQRTREHGGIEAAENLLDAYPVERDEHDVVGAGAAGVRVGNGGREQQGHKGGDHQSSHETRVAGRCDERLTILAPRVTIE
jgi:hypothetical protein